MAPTKQPKKPVKSEKPIEKPIMKAKAKKKNYQSFSMYVYKVLKSLAGNLRISKSTMVIMNNLVNDVMEIIAVEAGRLLVYNKRTTLSGKDIRSAVRLVMPGELAKHANIEGMKAMTQYNINTPKLTMTPHKK